MIGAVFNGTLKVEVAGVYVSNGNNVENENVCMLRQC